MKNIILAAALILVMAPTNAKKLTDAQEEPNIEIMNQCFHKIQPSIQPEDWSDKLFFDHSVDIYICMQENGIMHSDDGKDDE